MPSLVDPVSITQRRERIECIGVIILQGKPKCSETDVSKYYFVHHIHTPRNESILPR